MSDEVKDTPEVPQPTQRRLVNVQEEHRDVMKYAQRMTRRVAEMIGDAHQVPSIQIQFYEFNRRMEDAMSRVGAIAALIAQMFTLEGRAAAAEDAIAEGRVVGAPEGAADGKA